MRFADHGIGQPRGGSCSCDLCLYIIRAQLRALIERLPRICQLELLAGELDRAIDPAAAS